MLQEYGEEKVNFSFELQEKFQKGGNILIGSKKMALNF